MTGERKGTIKSRRARRITLAFGRNARMETQQGAALITVLLLTLLLLVFGASLAQLATVEKRTAAGQAALTQALYLAEAGVEMQLARMAADFTAGPPSTPITLGDGQISKITVTTVDAGTREILAEGMAGGARKSLRVRVQCTAAPVLQNAICSGSSFTPNGSVSITGNLLVRGDLDCQNGVSIEQAGLVVVGGNLTNKNGSIGILPGGSLLAGGDLDNRHGKIGTPGYLQVDGSINNNSGEVAFFAGGAYYTPSTQYPAGTFVIQNGGQVPRLDGPRENIGALIGPAASLDPAGKVAACQGYPKLFVEQHGNRYEGDLTGRGAGSFYLDTGGEKLWLEGRYSGKWLLAVKGDVEISGDLLPVNAGSDVLVLLVDGTVSVRGNENISAVIYAGRYESQGSSTVRGTVVAQFFDVGGNVSLIQDTGIIQNAVQVSALPPGLATVKIISWREEHNVF